MSFYFYFQCNTFYFIKETTSRKIPTNLQLGDDCGQCFCPPDYTMGECAPGLECIHNDNIPDAPGKCVNQSASIGIFEGINHKNDGKSNFIEAYLTIHQVSR